MLDDRFFVPSDDAFARDPAEIVPEGEPSADELREVLEPQPAINGNRRKSRVPDAHDLATYNAYDVDPPRETTGNLSNGRKRAIVEHSRPNIIRMSDVKPRAVDWLWSGKYAIGKLSVLAGDPGQSKSTVALDMASRISRGAAWPDGSPNQRGGVVLLSAEDDPEDTIAPRLIAAGADMSRIVALSSITIHAPDADPLERSVGLRDLPAIEEAIDQVPDPRFVVIDPVSAFTGETDSHKNAEVRGMLAPLAKLAARKGVAVLLVSHLNKSSGSSALYRTTGSLAFVAAARAVWLVIRDPDDHNRRLMLPAKNNLGPDGEGMAYTVKSAMGGNCPIISWEELPVKLTADKALAAMAPQKPERRTKADDAADWLSGRLMPGESAPAADILAEGEKAGFKPAALKRAKEAMAIESTKTPEGCWLWERF